MAIRGRKPKPTALKVLEGNPGHRPLNQKDRLAKGKLPDCPDWLEDDAKEEWERLGGVLAEMGMLNETDRAAFAGYCQAYARWKAAEKFITQHGDMFRTPSGYIQQVPQVSIAQTNLKIMLKFCEQFGLTPSARSRLIGADNDEENAADAMELILGGR